MDLLLKYGLLALGLALTIVGWFWRRSVKQKSADDPKALKKQKTWSSIVLVVGLWCLTEEILKLLFGAKEAEEFSVSIWASSPSRPEMTSSWVRLLMTFFRELYTLELMRDSAFWVEPLKFWMNFVGSSIRHNTKQSEIMDFLSEVITSLGARSYNISLLLMGVSD